MISKGRNAFAVTLALSTATATASAEWVVTGSGPDMRVTLRARKVTPAALAPDRPQLVLMCRKHEAKLAIVMDSGRDPGQLRFDGDDPIAPRVYRQEKLSWFSSRNKVIDPDVYYFERTDETVSLLLSHASLLLSGEKFDRAPQYAAFGLAGLERHLGRFEQACGMKKTLPRPQGASAGSSKGAPASPAAPILPRMIGGWRISRTVSPLDDEPIVVVSGSPKRTGGTSSNLPTLAFRCRRGEMEAFLSFERRLFAPPNHLPVQASVDGGEPKQWWLIPSGNSTQAYFFASGPHVLKRLLASREFRVSLGPKKRKKGDDWIPEAEVAYPMGDLEGASRVLRERCPVDLAQLKVKDGLGPLP